MHLPVGADGGMDQKADIDPQWVARVHRVLVIIEAANLKADE
jgi:hypothetical protein